MNENRIDVVGGDYAPQEIVHGASALNDQQDLELILLVRSGH